MSDKELERAIKLYQAFAKLTPEQQEQLLCYAEGYAEAKTRYAPQHPMNQQVKTEDYCESKE